MYIHKTEQSNTYAGNEEVSVLTRLKIGCRMLSSATGKAKIDNEVFVILRVNGTLNKQYVLINIKEQVAPVRGCLHDPALPGCMQRSVGSF